MLTNVTHLDSESILVDFSDGTSATFYVHELTLIRPERTAWDCEAEEEF